MADTFLVIGKNEVVSEEKIPDGQDGRANVLWQGRRVKLHTYEGVHYVVEFYLDPDHVARVLGPYVKR